MARRNMLPETFSALELHLGHWRRLAKMPGSWLRKLATQLVVALRSAML